MNCLSATHTHSKLSLVFHESGAFLFCFLHHFSKNDSIAIIVNSNDFSDPLQQSAMTYDQNSIEINETSLDHELLRIHTSIVWNISRHSAFITTGKLMRLDCVTVSFVNSRIKTARDENTAHCISTKLKWASNWLTCSFVSELIAFAIGKKQMKIPNADIFLVTFFGSTNFPRNHHPKTIRNCHVNSVEWFYGIQIKYLMVIKKLWNILLIKNGKR